MQEKYVYCDIRFMKHSIKTLFCTIGNFETCSWYIVQYLLDGDTLIRIRLMETL